jgi:hypothetical protein
MPLLLKPKKVNKNTDIKIKNPERVRGFFILNNHR